LAARPLKRRHARAFMDALIRQAEEHIEYGFDAEPPLEMFEGW